MKSRVLVAVIGVPLLVYLVLWGPVVFMTAALCVLAGEAGRELERCVSGGKRSGAAAAGAAFPILTVACYGFAPEAAPLLFVLGTTAIFAWAVLQAGGVKFDQLMAALFAGVGIGYSFASFLRMAGSGSPRYLLLLPFLLSFACDTFAFFAGKGFGRHKLAPVVSPHKTVEGAVGGLAGNILCVLLFAWAARRFAGSGMGYGAAAALGLVCGIAAQIGDLSFSLIKREYGIKDYGRLFLEHGGVLDRFDSVLFVAPVVEALVWHTAFGTYFG